MYVACEYLQDIVILCKQLPAVVIFTYIMFVAVDCGDLMEPANGAVNLSEGSLVGADATYTCDPSFRLIGTTSRTCQQNGSWSGEAPVCEGDYTTCM